MRRILIAAAALCLAGAAYTRLVVAPWYLQRLPPGTTWSANFVGIKALPDEQTGAFPPLEVGAYIHFMRIVDDSARPHAVVVEDSYTTRDAVTGKIDYQYVIRDRVDPHSGQLVDGEHAGDYYVLPRFAERRTYRLSASYLRGVEIQYEGEEVVAGLPTYVYQYRGDIEYTVSYRGSPEFPGVPVAHNEEIRCSDAQFLFRAWVEPVTGEIVKVQESCRSGDYVYARGSDRPLRPVMIWGGETAGNDVLERSRHIAAARWRILLSTYYVPAGLLGAALVAAAAAALVRPKS